MKIDSDLSEADIKDATLKLHDKIYELVLLNLVDQENVENNKALSNAIKYLQRCNDQKSKDLLNMICTQLSQNNTERNTQFIKQI